MKTINELMAEVNKIRIEEFLESLNIKPVKREGNILTYNAPYALDITDSLGPDTFGKPTCLVDTERNLWCDKCSTPWQPLMMLAYEMTGYYNLYRLVGFITDNIKDYRKQSENNENISKQNHCDISLKNREATKPQRRHKL